MRQPAGSRPAGGLGGPGRLAGRDRPPSELPPPPPSSPQAITARPVAGANGDPEGRARRSAGNGPAARGRDGAPHGTVTTTLPVAWPVSTTAIASPARSRG